MKGMQRPVDPVAHQDAACQVDIAANVRFYYKNGQAHSSDSHPTTPSEPKPVMQSYENTPQEMTTSFKFTEPSHIASVSAEHVGDHEKTLQMLEEMRKENRELKERLEAANARQGSPL
jgi:hypothetical protein